MLVTMKMSDFREMYKEWLAKRELAKRKEEFRMRLKHGKPQGNTRPPFRLTDDPGPH